MIIVASFNRESRKRIICDYIMREMICSQVISYGTSILQLTKWDWVSFCLSPYIPILKEKGNAYFFFLINSLLWNPKVMTQSITNMIAWWHISTCNTRYLVVLVDNDQFLRIGQKKSPGLKHGISKHYLHSLMKKKQFFSSGEVRMHLKEI